MGKLTISIASFKYVQIAISVIKPGAIIKPADVFESAPAPNVHPRWPFHPPGTLQQQPSPASPKAFRSSQCTRRKWASARRTRSQRSWSCGGWLKLGSQNQGFLLVFPWFWSVDCQMSYSSERFILKCRGCASHVREGQRSLSYDLNDPLAPLAIKYQTAHRVLRHVDIHI